MDIDLFFLILNSIVTFSCGITILLLTYLKIIERHLLYYFWLIGFIPYAFEIFYGVSSEKTI